MASAAVQAAPGNTFGTVVEPFTHGKKVEKHDIHSELNYYDDPKDGSLPAPTYVHKPELNKPTPLVSLPVVVHDVAGDEEKYTLDSHGFQYVKHESVEKDFQDEEQIKAQYYPEIEQLLKDTTGGNRVFIFDHTIRRATVDERTAGGQRRGPGRRVHIDQSYDAAVSRVRHHLPEEADELLKKRFNLINVWRPIKTIGKDPLVLSDAHSVPESDLVVQKLIYPDREGETLAVKPNPAHKWYFKYAQRPDEPLFIKCYDSLEDGRARRIPHSAIVDPRHENDPEPRESIEVRTLVFYDY